MLLEDLFAWIHYDLDQQKNKEAGLLIAKRLRELADIPNAEDAINNSSGDLHSKIAKS